MKVIHIESGLGNQMLSYCELLSLKYMNPEEDFYIETLVYEFPEAAGVINQWQGYELENIFQLKVPNIRTKFTDRQWNEVVADIRESHFWNKKWNWPVYFTDAFRKQGLELHVLRDDFEKKAEIERNSITGWRRNNILYKQFQKTWMYSNLRRIVGKSKPYTKNDLEYLFYHGIDDVLTGQKLSFMYKNNNIEAIDSMIRESFIFPEIEDETNRQLQQMLLNTESVAIHARRGDMLNLNNRYYKGGYFKRAVKYIKKNICNPVFFFFCDPGSTEWCRENPHFFGLDFKRDRVFFVDWNKENNSFRDMQLMSMCKHNIITISSFGWWGAYLNENPMKITISPEIYINTKYHM